MSPLPGPTPHFWIQIYIYIYIFIGQELGAAKNQKFTPKTNRGWSKKQLGEGEVPPPTDSGPKRLHLGLIFNSFGGFCYFGVPIESEAVGRAVSPQGQPPHSRAPVLGGSGLPLLCLVPACTYPLYRAGGALPPNSSIFCIFGFILDINCVIFLYTF